MGLDVDKEIKIAVYIGIIVMLIYGLWLFISPESYYTIVGVVSFSPTTARYLAGVYIAWSIALILLLKHLDNWEMIEKWVIFATIANALGLIACIISLIAYNIGIGRVIITMILNIFFTVVGIHILIQKRK